MCEYKRGFICLAFWTLLLIFILCLSGNEADGLPCFFLGAWSPVGGFTFLGFLLHAILLCSTVDSLSLY